MVMLLRSCLKALYEKEKRSEAQGSRKEKVEHGKNVVKRVQIDFFY